MFGLWLVMGSVLEILAAIRLFRTTNVSGPLSDYTF